MTTSGPSALRLAAALSLGAAVSLGLARFSYALLLPPMRDDLGWSYLVAGAMNTANACGYLVGALAAPLLLARLGAARTFTLGIVFTGLVLMGHGLATADAALAALRLAAGTGSAATFVAGGLLAARLTGGRDGRSAGLVLGLYYGGVGAGIVASAAVVPWLAGRAVAHAWQGAWIGLGLLALACAAGSLRAARRIDAEAAASAPVGAAGAGAGTLSPAAVRRALRPALVAYFGFGLGYIGYMTFIVSLLREAGLGASVVLAFYVLLGIAVTASSFVWAGLLQRSRGGRAMATLDALLAAATLLPVLSGAPWAAFLSGGLFGGVFLSVVASTTALVRHNLPPAAWPVGIASFTVVFAAGQIVGPSLVGWVADSVGGGLKSGLLVSSAVLAIAAAVASRQRPLDRGAEA